MNQFLVFSSWIYILCLWKLYLCLDTSYDYSVNIGTFWHITDIHVDQNYSTKGNIHDLCHENRLKNKGDNGIYGNFLCDSPQLLVNVTIKAMQSIHPHPDFIIWTGDNLPHTKLNVEWNVIFEAIKNVSDLLRDAFPSTPIFPCIGNHDTFPPNVLLPDKAEESIYARYLNEGGWNRLLSQDAFLTFKTGGYYSSLINPGLRIISLNTILWYTPNTFTQKLTDPANQFEWMEKVLRNCSKDNVKVYIIGHVPPGFYSRTIPGHKADALYHSQYLKKYLNLIKEYFHIIEGQMFGHLHLDMFQLFQVNTGVFLNSALLASSVTPWYYPNKIISPVNPSVRLIQYNVDDSTLKDYFQYFFNLTQANAYAKQSKRKSAKYELLYTFTKAYGVPDLSTRSLVKVYEKLKSDPETYKLFFKYMTASKESMVCDKKCVTAQLCSMACISEEEYNFCMTSYKSKDISC